MLVTYWRAALLAAAMVFSANAVRAEDQPGKGSDCCKGKECAQKCDQLNCKILILQGKKSEAGCCQTGSCCAATSKAGQCCKDKECSKDAECCKGECSASGGCCTAKTAAAKTTTFSHPIIVFVPVPMMPPMNHVVMPQAIASQPYHIAPPAPMAAPPMPSQPVAMPIPAPMAYPCPPGYAPTCPVATSSGSDVDLDTCVSVLGMVADVCFAHQQTASIPSMCLSALGLLSDLCGQTCSTGMTLPSTTYVQHPPQYIPPSPPFPPTESAAVLPPPREIPASAHPIATAPPMLTCDLVCPVSTTACANKIRIKATPDDGQLEMSIGDDTCMTCKKMTVKVGDCSLTMTTADGKVRIRSPELKGWADCVQTDRKERLILKGDVVLHYKKDGQHADVTGEYIELNLATGAVTVKQTSSSAKPAAIGEAILYGGDAP